MHLLKINNNVPTLFNLLNFIQNTYSCVVYVGLLI